MKVARAIAGRIIYEIGWLVQRHPISEAETRWYDLLGYRIQGFGIAVMP